MEMYQFVYLKAKVPVVADGKLEMSSMDLILTMSKCSEQDQYSVL